MSADLLRRAAASIRERAEAATAEDEVVGGQWVARPMMRPENQGWRVDFAPEVDGFDSTLVQTPYDYEGSLATHLSGWHPSVALAVADWLDLMANKAAINIKPDLYIPGFHSALAVARAYLGEDA